MSSNNRPISGRQIAAARELLDITQRDLVEALGINATTLARIESAKHRTRESQVLTLIVRELERRGIEFINGRGVILRKPGQESPTELETAGE
jgi:transcriptional regulator with XRE-family HTH domain